MKKFLQNNYIQNIVSMLIYVYINFVRYTSYFKQKNYDNDYQLISKKSAIYIFWHGKMMMIPHISPRKRIMNVLISSHKDGKIIAKVMKFFGFKIIEGSTNRRSFQALKNILYKLSAGENIAITPDGPRGPSNKINSNLLQIAYKTQSPIIPLSFTVKRFHTFKSWDKFYFAYPFNYGKLITGKIFYITKSDPEYLLNKTLEIENELNNIEQNV